MLVTDVAGDSVAASAGFEPGDVVIELNRKPLASPDDYRKAVKAVKPGDTVLVRVRRGSAAQFLTLKLPR